MACHQRQYSTLSILIIQIRIKTNKQKNNKLSYCDGHGGPNLISTRTSASSGAAGKTNLTASHGHSHRIRAWKGNLLTASTHIFTCLYLSCLMPIVFIVAVLLDGDKDNKFSKQDSMNEIYLHCKRHDLLTAEGCCHRKYAVRYLTASGLQPVHNVYWNVLWITEIICLILLTHSIKYIW